MQVLDLSTKPHVRGVKHWHEEINQLYHPTGDVGQDSQDIVYSYSNLNSTKFVPILLKEWFYLVKEGGYLVIDYLPKETCNFQKLEESMWWLWKMKYNIVYHGTVASSELKNLGTEKLLRFVKNPPNQPDPPAEDGNHFRFVCKKLVSTKIPGDNIDRWTFGMITKGERNEWIEEIIQAIHKQKVPYYEIIVCGAYFDREEKNFTYIPFREREFKPGGWKGWITKQKNVIARAAKYENLCIIHDRIVLDKDWFKGMKKYGNCFELLSNKQILRGTNIRAGDWLTYGSNKLGIPFGISKLEYTDWDEYIYISGQLTIWKKYVWELAPWNETRYWGEEDVEQTYRTRDLGFIPRFNPRSLVEALAWRFGDLPSKYYLSEGLLPKDMLLRRVVRKINALLFSMPFYQQIIFPFVRVVIKSRVYNYITRH